jgi:hypothetical protein
MNPPVESTQPTPEPARSAPSPQTPRRCAGQSLACGWCGSQFTVARTGRTPKWCSAACRRAAWNASRNAKDRATAVRVVDRVITTERVERVEVPTIPQGAAWVVALFDLRRQLLDGTITDRELRAVAKAAVRVNNTLASRLTTSNRW